MSQVSAPPIQNQGAALFVPIRSLASGFLYVGHSRSTLGHWNDN